MNNLSWLLYWADVLPQLATAVKFVSFLLALPVLIAFFLAVFDFFGDAVYNEDGSPRNDEARVAIRIRKTFWLPSLLLPLLWFSAFLVPTDAKTYYAIAASEMGEELLKTPEVGKARQALNNWLDEQLKEEEETSE